MGASGAIYGVLGAYLVLYPYNKVNVVVLYYVVSMPAILVIGIWAAMQFFNGYGALFATEQTGGVAYWAHIGGLVAGVVIAFVFKAWIPEEPDSINYRNYQQDSKARRLW